VHLLLVSQSLSVDTRGERRKQSLLENSERARSGEGETPKSSETGFILTPFRRCPCRSQRWYYSLLEEACPAVREGGQRILSKQLPRGESEGRLTRNMMLNRWVAPTSLPFH
jgi:hypothetical protein